MFSQCLLRPIIRSKRSIRNPGSGAVFSQSPDLNLMNYDWDSMKIGKDLNQTVATDDLCLVLQDLQKSFSSYFCIRGEQVTSNFKKV